MSKINWCFNTERGIEFVDVNDNLSIQYMKEAEYNLSTMLDVKGKWKTIIAYYSCYNALYSLLMKAGIKCEIHDCTVAIVQYVDGLNAYSDFLTDLKKNRIDVQYYLKEDTLVDEKNIKEFVSKCKELLLTDLSYLKLKLEEIKND